MKALAVTVLVAAGMAGCSSNDIVVFEKHSGAGQGGDTSSSSTGTQTTGEPQDAGMDGDSGVSGDCSDATECPYGWYCEKPSCDAPLGTCQTRPVFCDSEPDPVCGCNGATYWNECVRRQLGVPASVPGECQASAVQCFTHYDCPPPAYCALLRFADQGCPMPGSPPITGTCWAVPPNCTDTLSYQHWQFCPPPEAPPPPEPFPCVDTCVAIQSRLIHLQIPDASQCP